MGEEVFLKNFFPFTETKILKKIKSLKSPLARFPIECVKRIRLRNFSRVLLRKAELCNTNKKLIFSSRINGITDSYFQDNFNFTPQIKQINSAPHYLCFSIQFFFETNIYVYSNPSIPTLKTKYINFFVGRRYKKMYKTVNLPFYNLKTKMVSSATPINYRKKNIKFKRFLIFYR